MIPWAINYYAPGIYIHMILMLTGVYIHIILMLTGGSLHLQISLILWLWNGGSFDGRNPINLMSSLSSCPPSYTLGPWISLRLSVHFSMSNLIVPFKMNSLHPHRCEYRDFKKNLGCPRVTQDVTVKPLPSFCPPSPSLSSSFFFSGANFLLISWRMISFPSLKP